MQIAVPDSGRCLHISLLFALIFCTWLPLRAAAPSFTFEILPDSLELQSCITGAPLIVVARNTGHQPIASLTIATTPDPRFNLSPFDPPPSSPLKAGDQRRWNYRVTCTDAFDPSSLVLIATASSSRKPSALSQILVKSIPIKLRPPDPLDAIATVGIKTNLDLLTQATDGDLLVAVTNKTSEPIHFKVWPEASNSVLFRLADGQTAATSASAASQPINGGDTFTFRFAVTAKTRVSPGKQLLGINVHLESAPPRDFLVTQDVTVGVLGESEALKLLGIPSLLFLPGFLVMTSFLGLWRANFLRPVGDASTISITEKDPGYWVIAIALSAMILWAFVLNRSSFLTLYGIEDIAEVWIASILLGTCSYTGMRLYLNYRERHKFPQPDDSPLEILKKLSYWKMAIDLPMVNLKESTQPAFLLGKEADGAVYICPGIILTWKSTADSNVHARLEDLLVRGGDPMEIARIIQQQNSLDPPSQSGIKILQWDNKDVNCSTPRKIGRDLYVSISNNREILLTAKDE